MPFVPWLLLAKTKLPSVLRAILLAVQLRSMAAPWRKLCWVCKPRLVTIQAVTCCELLLLKKHDYETIHSGYKASETDLRFSHLQHCPLFKQWTEDRLRRIVSLLTVRRS